MDTQESALIIIVSEAERLVKSFRDRFDPAAGWGIPAHISVLYPFMTPQDISAAVLAELSQLFASCTPFDFSLAEVRRFPEVLYLAPQPADPFRKLTERVVARYPDCLPYGGAFPEIIPHMTLAQVVNPQELDIIEHDFLERCGDQLPMRTRASEAALIDNEEGVWHVHARFAFGSA